MKIGFVLNPVAGMGGKVALKGTDGAHTLEEALRRGATQVSPQRALAALLRLLPLKERFDIITPKGSMGEAVLRKTDLRFTLLSDFDPPPQTDSLHTQRVVQSLAQQGIELLVFAGGDGTACDICKIFDTRIPVIGIPSGVKMHSAVFGINPERTGDLIAAFIEKSPMEIKDAEIMDINAPALKKGRVSASLAGYLKTLYKKTLSQNPKSGSPVSDRASQNAIAMQIYMDMEKDVQYLIGPGTTLKALTDLFEFEGTLLGVDLVQDKTVVQKDLTENEILKSVKKRKTCLVLTPVGGQGYLLGRGNQQISPEVLHHIPKENIIIAATAQKLASFEGRPLLVDTGCTKTNAHLKGYVRVITGMNETMMMKIDF